MKKILPIGLLTLCFAVAAQERASAWINSRFGIGLNWGWQSGGNNLLWGLFRDGQPCGPDIYCAPVPVYPRPACYGGCAPGCGYGGGYPLPGVAVPPPVAAPVAGPGFGAPGLAGPGLVPPGFGPGPGGPGFGGPIPPGAAPVSTNGGLFGGPEHAIQVPTPPNASGAQPVSYYQRSNYGYYYPTYRPYR